MTSNKSLIAWGPSCPNEMGQFLAEKIGQTEKLDILTGYFFFDGLEEIRTALLSNADIKIRILVGMDAGIDTRELIYRIYERENEQKTNSNKEEFRKEYLQQLRIILAHYDPKQATESQRKSWLMYADMIDSGRLQIRKTSEDNHSKLYIFHGKDGDISYTGGSSNFTHSGLSGRHEFNIHVRKDFTDEVTKIFAELWDCAIPITTFKQYGETSERPVTIDPISDNLRNQTPLNTLSPFDACMKLMYEYLKLNRSDVSSEARIKDILDSVGYNRMQYQIDAVSRAKKILDTNGGVIIADVVGLGKSVMASVLARLTNAPGIVIAPPGLIPAETKGWKYYLKEFHLDEMGWKAFSMYDNSLDNAPSVRDAKYVIIDEAHNLRNPETELYQSLQRILSGKKLIALSATPYNNRPDDLKSLLDLFPGPNIAGETKTNFIGKIAEIAKNHKGLRDDRRTLTNNADKRENSEALNKCAEELRPFIYPVTIRRNRIDLLKNDLYRREVEDRIPKLMQPINCKFDLTPEQNHLYDAILNKYFAGVQPVFKGAMYQPEFYTSQNKDKKQVAQIQTNLYSMICHVIVARWESSPEAFSATIQNLHNSLNNSIAILERYGIFFKGTELPETDSDQDPTALLSLKELAAGEENTILEQIRKSKKSSKVYVCEERKGDIEKAIPEKKGSIAVFSPDGFRLFMDDLKNDQKVLDDICKEFCSCGMGIITEDGTYKANPANDGKLKALKDILDKIINGEISSKFIDPLSGKKEEASDRQMPGNPRKVIVFSDAADTARYVRDFLESCPEFKGKTLYADGTEKKTDKNFLAEITKHFMSLKDGDKGFQESKAKTDEKMILVTTDVLSEGVNLNQGGVVINYDIAYNPVRIIQRLGRINRIDQKVFERIYNVNFFPTGPEDTHADINRLEDISVEKMKNIHSLLGEDGCILSVEEKPKAFLDQLNPDTFETTNSSEETRIASMYEEGLKIKCNDNLQERNAYIAMLKDLAPRWTVIGGNSVPQLYLFQRNKASFFVTRLPDLDNTQTPAEFISCFAAFQELFDCVKSAPETSSLPFEAEKGNLFWEARSMFYGKNAFVPSNTKFSTEQKEMFRRLKSVTCDDLKKIIGKKVRADKVFAKNLLSVWDDQQKLRDFLEKNLNLETTTSDNFVEVMLVGIAKEQ